MTIQQKHLLSLTKRMPDILIHPETSLWY